MQRVHYLQDARRRASSVGPGHVQIRVKAAMPDPIRSRTGAAGAMSPASASGPRRSRCASSDGYTFLFGDLSRPRAAPRAHGVVRHQSYQKSDYGLVPWRERAEVLRKGMVARVPPTALVAGRWSAPK